MENLDRFKSYFIGGIKEIYDSYCDEPVAWGYYLNRNMPSESFNELRSLGTVEYIDDDKTWFLITRVLTREEAIIKYGQITEEIFGPRGGWKSVTFGSKKFSSKRLKP